MFLLLSICVIVGKPEKTAIFTTFSISGAPEADLWFLVYLGKISRLCTHVFRYADSRYFCSPLPSLVPLAWCPVQLP